MKHLDLTLTISKSIPSFPGSPSPQFISWSSIKDDGYNLELLFLSSHTGTHLDAPYHFAEKGAKIHQIPLTRLVGNALLIKIKKVKDQTITKNDLLEFERKNGKIQNFSSIIFFTDWQKNSTLQIIQVYPNLQLSTWFQKKSMSVLWKSDSNCG